MPGPRSRAWPLLLALLVGANADAADVQGFLAAERAFAGGDLAAYAPLAAALRDDPLSPYLRAAELLADLDQADPAAVLAFVNRYAGSAPGEKVRRLWLQQLAEQGRWSDYLAAWRDNGAETRDCQHRRALLATGQGAAAFDGLADRYLTGGTLPDACDPLLAAWAAQGGLTPALAWQRIALALAQGNTGVAAYQRRWLPAAEQPWLDLLLKLHRAPATLAVELPTALAIPDPLRRTIVIGHALERLARKDLGAARAVRAGLDRDQRMTPALAERADLAIGTALARAGDPAALDYLARIPARADNLEAQHARLSAARRLRAWGPLADWAALLPADGRGEGEWDWWRARALLLRGDRVGAAHALAAASRERTLWGFLAADLLGRPPALRDRPTPVDQTALRQLLGSGIAERVAALRQLGREADVRREWQALTEGLTGPALVTAPVIAVRLGLPNEAILTQARSDWWDDLSIRFPLAYQPLVTAAAEAQGLPVDWVFAIIRQESAFNPEIASPAGAIGLMQLMPVTAAEVARGRGETAPDRLALTDPARNVGLGADYLARMRARLGHPLAATAAYNAGPNAVARWLGDPVAGDLWLTDIPYQETRDYVRRVLTYRVIYRHRLGLPPLRLNALLRPVAAAPG